MMIAEGPEELEAFQAMVDGFNESQDGVTAKLIPLSEEEDFTTRLSTDIAAGNAPDVFFENYRYLDRFVDKGAIAPMDDLISSADGFSTDDLYPAAVEAYEIDGKQYCLPFNASSLVVYYREDLFEQAGVEPPGAGGWTWQEFTTAARKLTEGDVYGVGVSPELIRVMPFIWSNGGEVADAEVNPNRLTLGSGPALAAMQSFLSLGTSGSAPPEAMVEAEGLESLFVKGKLAMMLESRKVVPEFRAAGDLPWNVAPLPRFQEPFSILHSDGYCITEASEHKEEAFAFIEYAVSKEGQEFGARAGRAVPANIEVAESEAFLDPNAKPADSQVFLDNLEHIGKVPISPVWGEVEQIADGVIEEAFFEGEGAEEVAVQIDRQTRPVLAGESTG